MTKPMRTPIIRMAHNWSTESSASSDADTLDPAKLTADLIKKQNAVNIAFGITTGTV